MRFVISVLVFAAAASAEVLPLDGAELRVPESYERVDAKSEKGLGVWRKRHPQEAGRPDDILTIRTLAAGATNDLHIPWTEGIEFTGEARMDFVRLRGGEFIGRVQTSIREVDGVELSHVAVCVPLKKTTVGLFVRGAAKHLIGLRREMEEMAVALVYSAGGARWFPVDRLRTSVQIPAGYARATDPPRGLPAEWAWNRADGRADSIGLSLVLSEERRDREWSAGREFTWGNFARDRWLWREGEIRAYEGVRVIDGRQELRIAIHVPVTEDGLAIFARGPLEEQDRLRQSVGHILESLGALRQQAMEFG